MWKNNKIRRFAQTDENELLPIKICGKLVRQYKDEIKEEIDNENSQTVQDLKSQEPELILTVQELLIKQQNCLIEIKNKISNLSNATISFPHENILKIKELYELCIGNGVDPLIRETIQKLAIASLTEVFISIIPGYYIRKLTETEQQQKMKLETKNVMQFEIRLISNYEKFIQILEKNALKLTKKLDSNKFSTKIGFISTKCLCKLLIKAYHFNFSNDIIKCLVQLTRSPDSKVVNEICNTFSDVLKNDILLKVSLDITKAISRFVNIRGGRVLPQLLYVFLSLRIQNVEKNTIAEQHENKEKQKKILRSQHFSRNEKKNLKRNRKIYAPLEEAEAVEKVSTKLKLATETMNFVFMTYFRVLKRMPTTLLIEPVLEGLAKFAHLINVDFFEDLVSTLGDLVDQKDLRFADSLRCVKTVCVIISDEGEALNIDPLRFYNALYKILPSLVFQDIKNLPMHTELLSDCIEVLLIKRRKVVPLSRVAAYIKRIMLLILTIPDINVILCLLSTIRSVLIAHPSLCNVLVSSENDEDCISNGIYLPDSVDPDCCNCFCTNIIQELKFLTKTFNKNQILRSFCINILNQVPSKGPYQINIQWTLRRPHEWFIEKNQNVINPLKQIFAKFCSKRKISCTPANICSILQLFVDQSSLLKS